MVAAGTLDRRIELQRAVTAKNTLNEDVASWTTFATVWAGKADVSDGERVRAAEVGAVLTTRFIIRHSSVTATLTAKDRIVHDRMVYDISGIKELGRRVGREITAASRPDVEPY